MKIAMWSGPRNLSTAMMYSFGNRDDFDALDEPFYAPYLAQSGIEHPMGSEIMRAHETDPNKVPQQFNPHSERHLYMKHMPHHMLADFPIDWAQDCINIHLLRHPARVIASYSAKRGEVTTEDIGYAQQLKIYEKLGGIVIDSADIRANPERALRKLCSEIGLNFDPAMLSWASGPRTYDGIWAAHWYGAVHKSTGFAKPEAEVPKIDPALTSILRNVMPIYQELADRVTRL